MHRFPYDTISTGWGEIDMADNVIAVHSVPLFHAGGMIGVFYAVSGKTLLNQCFVSFLFIQPTCGFTMTVFRPESPAIVPNTANCIEVAISDGFDYVRCTPSFLEVRLPIFKICYH